MKKTLLFLVLLAGFVAGCKDNATDPNPDSMGYAYFPVEVGAYRIYNVTDIKFMHNVGDTTRFQLRERVDTTFLDQTNTLNYKIVRSVRANENSQWRDDSVVVVTKSATNVLLTKDNTKYVKLIFPVKAGNRWAGDMYNDHIIVDPDPFLSDSDPFKWKEVYTYESVGEPYQLAGSSFPNTITVKQGRPKNKLLGVDERKEVYAEGVGLIYRLFDRAEFTSCTPDNCKYGEEYKISGHQRHEVLSSYGTLK